MRLEDATLLVLAGGRGLRLGRGDKAMALVAGRPMIARVLELAPRFARTLVVAPEAMDRRALGFPVVADEARGAPAALAAGLSACETGWAVALACDLPLVDPVVLARLAALAEGDLDAVVPEAAGRAHPLHAIYRTSVSPLARAVALDGGRLLDLLARVRTRRVPLDDPRSVTNVNTPEDLAACERALRRGR